VSHSRGALHFAGLVKYNKFRSRLAHSNEFAFGFNAATKRPLAGNKRDNKQEQARNK